MATAPYTQAELERTLADLRRRFPSATADDAHTIIVDSIWAEEDENHYFAREMGAIERSHIYGTDALDELAAEQDECARFRA